MGGYGEWGKRLMRYRVLLLLCAAVPIATLSASETTTYGYDALGRLVSTSQSGGPRSGKTNAQDYDPVGNRTAIAIGQPLPGPAPNASVFSISGPATISEGGTAIFTISRTGTASAPLSVNYATSNGTAAAPGDFSAASGTMTFLAWETARTFAVTVHDDGVSEGAEQFSVVLSSPSSGATIGTGTVTTTIASNGPANQPPVAVSDDMLVGTCRGKTVNVLANDTDPEGNLPLALVSISYGGGMGTATMVGTDSIRFQAYSAPGPTGVIYTVRDSLGATSIGYLDIVINDLGGCN